MHVFIIFAALVATNEAVAVGRQREAAEAMANPIRKVVTLLQNMQKKVEAEGEKEEELVNKFMCYCKTGGSTLKESIAAAETKSPQVTSSITAAEAQNLKLKEDLRVHKSDRENAKAAQTEAIALREKEHILFLKFAKEKKDHIKKLSGAIQSIETGLAAFLQSDGARAVKEVVLNQVNMFEEDRRQVLSFLSGGDEAGPGASSQACTGILKQLLDEMTAALAEAEKDEAAAVKSHAGLLAAKDKEIAATTTSIEQKTQRSGEISIQVVQMKKDSQDTVQSLAENKKYLADLEKSCATKGDEWEARKKVRAEEMLALADTIKLLNDDDALELFKKTLPSAASLLQVREGMLSLKERAVATLRDARRSNRHRPELEFIMMALRGKGGFDKVIGKIDEMVIVLKKEQADDDKKKEYCSQQFDQSHDKKKLLERQVADSEASIADGKEGVSTLTAEIAALKGDIAALDKSVSEATELRKTEHDDFTDLMASNSAAKQLLGLAKNRLNKFYNPKLYKPPAKRELSPDDRIAVNMGGTATPTAAPGGISGTGISAAQISADSAPPPPPETFGAYAKKSDENSGVTSMIDLLVKDLDKEMAEAETDEKNAQKDYENMMQDSAEKRRDDSTSLGSKEGSSAELQSEVIDHEAKKTDDTSRLKATNEYINSLHGECDWLLKYYEVRKDARTGEIESLHRAKAVLSGADYSLLQMRRRNFLGL